jgi:hypothetical protein
VVPGERVVGIRAAAILAAAAVVGMGMAATEAGAIRAKAR